MLVRTKILSGDDRDLGLFEKIIRQIAGRLESLAVSALFEERPDVRENIEGSLRFKAVDARNRI